MRDNPRLRLRREILTDLGPDELRRVAAGDQDATDFCTVTPAVTATVLATIRLSCIPWCYSRWCPSQPSCPSVEACG